MDTRYSAYELFLERLKVLKERKRVTNRIVTKEDIENVLSYILKAEREGHISTSKARQFTGFVIFGAYTGQRSMATMTKLTAGQFRETLKMDKPVVRITAKQCKIKFEHYCPLHLVVIAAIRPLIEGRDDDELVFSYISFANFVRKGRNEIPLSRIRSHFVVGDLRKFTEQYGDVISWEQSNRSYILTHEVSSVEWAHYRQRCLNMYMMCICSTGRMLFCFQRFTVLANPHCASIGHIDGQNATPIYSPHRASSLNCTQTYMVSKPSLE